MPGFGPVVTGSLVSGRDHAGGSKLELLPERRPVRVRRSRCTGARKRPRRPASASARTWRASSSRICAAGWCSRPRPRSRCPSRGVCSRVWSCCRPRRAFGAGTGSSFHHFASEAVAAGPRARGRRDRSRRLGARRAALSGDPSPSVPGDRFVVRRLSPVADDRRGSRSSTRDPLRCAAGRLEATPARIARPLETGPLGERLVPGSRRRASTVRARRISSARGRSPAAVRAALAAPL